METMRRMEEKTDRTANCAPCGEVRAAPNCNTMESVLKKTFRQNK